METGDPEPGAQPQMLEAKFEAKFVCVFTQEDGEVQQQETPIIFLMPCAMCAGPCAQPPCDGCSYSYCEQCFHICSATAMQAPLLEIKSETSGDTGSTSELRVCHDIPQ